MKTLKFLFAFLICYLVKTVVLKENENPEHFSHLGSGTTFVEIDPDLKPIPDHIEDEITQLQMTGQSVVISTKDHKDNKEKTKKMSQLKHSPSASVILFPDTSKKPEEMSKSIANLMERTIEPTQTVINLNKMPDILDNLHKLKLEDLPTLSKIIVVHDGKAYIPCLACAHQDTQRALVPIPKGSSEKELEKLWLDTNMDFMQMRVEIEDNVITSNPEVLADYAKKCGNMREDWLNINDDLEYETADPYLVCLRLYLLSHHNVDFHKDPTKPIIGQYATREVFPKELLDSWGKPKMSMIIHGYSTYNYVFGLIMEKTDFRVDPWALLQPFDLLIWMLLLLSLFLSTIVMYALAYSKSHDVPFWETFFFNVCLLLDQADNDFIRRRFRIGFWKAVPYLAGWMFCSFVLKTLYQGALYSSLSVSTMPPYPKNIKELMASELPVVFCYDDVKYIKDHINQLTRNWDESWAPISEEKSEFLNWLERKIYYFDVRVHDVVWILNSAKDVYEFDYAKLPKEFAVIGRQSNVELFTRLTKLFHKNKMEMRVDGELPLVKEKFVVSTKNVMNSQMSKTYSRLHESGILGHLQKWSDKVEPKMRAANWIKKERESGQMAEHLKKHSHSMMMAPDEASQEGKAELFPESKPVSFESVKYPFLFFFMLLGLATLVFFLEVIVSYLTEKCKVETRVEEIPLQELQ